MARGEQSKSPSRLRRAARGSWQSMLVTLVALGWARLWRAQISFDDHFEIYVCSGMRAGYGRAGTTFGGAYLTRDHTRFRTIKHESVHAGQWARYGLLFGPLYLIEEIRHPKARNRFEVEAGLADGGYAVPKDPNVSS